MGQTQFLNYDLKTKWLKDVLEEVQQNSSPDPMTESHIKLDLEVVRQKAPQLGDYLLLEGKMSSVYQVPCVRCLENGVQSMDTEFSVCVLDEILEEDEAFQDLDSYIIGEKEYQLYYTEKRQFNLEQCTHEQYFMNVEYLPLCDENCLGLCPECGANMNKESCPHKTSH